MTSIEENLEQLEHSEIAGGSTKWSITLEDSLQFLVQLNIRFPYDLAILLPGIYQKK